MNKRIFLGFTAVLIFLTFQMRAQGYYWVSFSDKNNTEYSLSAPEKYLSERAIDRRVKQNIPIDSLDLPVNSNYIDSVLNVGAELIHKSKWLNGVTVFSELDNFENMILKISFVDTTQRTKPERIRKSAYNKFKETGETSKEPIDSTLYGASVYQTGLMNGQFLHNQDFNGEGIQIAVLDAGFLNIHEYPAFDSLWANNQILGLKDFVDPDSDIFTTHYHGMSVLSCMGGNVPGELIGTARKASYWLIRSEDAETEYLIEEDNWVVAAEFADSVGTDIINSSLGYYVFDDSTANHTYNDMDGKTTRVTQAANIAASRGMLVFASAGNEGNDPWKYIIAPSDGDNVLGVGATSKFGFAAPFTSFGPAADGDIKPNVAAVGWNAYVQKSDGSLGFSNGTSFSSPVMAGMAACLWQANSNATAIEIKQAIEKSANLFNTPDSLLGYGIPDMKQAHQILGQSDVFEWETDKNWHAYPNPVYDYIVIQQKMSQFSNQISIEIFSVDGRLVGEWLKPGSSKIILSGLQALPQGILMLKISDSHTSETIKLYKYR